MKGHAIFASCVFWTAAAMAQDVNPFVRQTPPVAAPQSLPCPSAPPLPIRCWVGQKFMVLPDDFLATPMLAGNPVPGRYGTMGSTAYDEIAGKFVTVTDVESRPEPYSTTLRTWAVHFTVNDTGKPYTAITKSFIDTEADNMMVEGFAYLSDLQSARDRYLGKHVWILEKELQPLDKSGASVPFERFGAVTVSDVLAGADSDNPVRIVVKNAQGREGYADIRGSRVEHQDILASGAGTASAFGDYFSTTDPKKAHKWSTRVWAAIAKEQVFGGMTAEQARMSWGDPEKVNRTSGYGHVREQWVYGSRSYLYFEDGTLTSIQN